MEEEEEYLDNLNKKVEEFKLKLINNNKNYNICKNCGEIVYQDSHYINDIYSYDDLNYIKNGDKIRYYFDCLKNEVVYGKYGYEKPNYNL